MFPGDYNPIVFTEEESGKPQVLSKLLAVICELYPAEKVVLVSNYTQTLDILQEVCKCHGYAYIGPDEQTPISQRQQSVDGFNSKLFIFLLSSRADGMGLNFIEGSHLILYDIDWNQLLISRQCLECGEMIRSTLYIFPETPPNHRYNRGKDLSKTDQ